MKVEIKVYKGLMHGFLTMGGAIKEVSSVLAFIIKKLIIIYNLFYIILKINFDNLFISL